MRRLILTCGLPGFLLGIVGFFCLNFTTAFGADHHQEWATVHGMPGPSYEIYLTGVVMLFAGGLLLGYVWGKR